MYLYMNIYIYTELYRYIVLIFPQPRIFQLSTSFPRQEKAVRRSCRMTEGEMLPENLALKYPQMDSDGNRVAARSVEYFSKVNLNPSEPSSLLTFIDDLSIDLLFYPR